MIAIDVFNPENRIENPAIMAIRYGDDTPIYSAVHQSDVAAIIQNAPNFGGIAELIEATPENLKGKWIGIQVAVSHGTEALGHARIEWEA